MAAPVEEAPVTRMLAALEAMVAEAVAVVDHRYTAMAVMEGQAVHMAAEAEAEAHIVTMMAPPDLVAQKELTAVLVVLAAIMIQVPREEPEMLGRIPSEKGWILKALEPEVLLPPSMVEVAAVAVTEVSAVQLALVAWLAVAAEVAMAETAVLVVAIVVLVAVAEATAEMAVLEEAALTELAVAEATEKPEMAEQERPQELHPTTVGLPQEAEASELIFHPTSIMALADLASASSPTMHKEARR